MSGGPDLRGMCISEAPASPAAFCALALLGSCTRTTAVLSAAAPKLTATLAVSASLPEDMRCRVCWIRPTRA